MSILFITKSFPHLDQARMNEEISGQHPIATVIELFGFSELPVELVFDRGIGDLFVIRTAGN